MIKSNETNIFTKYVLGFIFNSNLSKVLLIRKQRPSWQKGLLNGVGGKIEKDEAPKEAMLRELAEETNLERSVVVFSSCLTMRFPHCVIHVFGGIAQDFDAVKKTTDEEPVVVNSDNLNTGNELYNLQYIVPLVKDYLTHTQLYKVLNSEEG